MIMLVGCLDENQIPRPSPVDQGVEDNFDARQPPVAPNTGSGYGSGYSGSAPAPINTDQFVDGSSDDMDIPDGELQAPLDFGIAEDDR